MYFQNAKLKFFEKKLEYQELQQKILQLKNLQIRLKKTNQL